MKRVPLCVVMLALATTAMAADDPFVGTYRLNVDESKSSGAIPVPSAATLVISEDGDNLVLAVSAKSAEGSTLDETTSLPKGGGALRRIDGGQLRYDSVTGTRTNATTIDIVTMQDGKEAVRMDYALSANREVLTRTIDGTSSRGQSVHSVLVFDRQ